MNKKNDQMKNDKGLKLSETVYEGIVADIVSGEIRSDFIITENWLIEKYHVSKSPVREALSQLCNEKLLTSLPRYGYRIETVDQAYLQGIIRLRLHLEPHYLNYYFQTITPEDITRIQNSIVKLDREIISTPMDYWKQTSRFHLQLAYSYHDQYYYEVLKRVLDKQLITFSMLYWHNWGSVIETRLTDNHSAIADAIADGKAEKAVFLLQQDIKSF